MESNCRDLVTEIPRDNNLLSIPPFKTNLEGFNKSTNLMYGLDEEDNSGLKLDERKGREGTRH